MTKQGIRGLLLVIPSFLLLLGTVIVPVFMAIHDSLQNDQGNYSLSNYVYLFTDKVMIANILFTLKITLIAGVLVMMISYGLAVYLRFSNSWMADLIRKLYYIPMFVPGVIATYGIITLYGNHGWLARVLLLFTAQPFPKIIFDMKGIILAEIWFNIPFSTMIMSSALAAIPNAVIESARDVGAGKIQLLTRFLIPLSYKTMMVAVTFIFMGMMGSFTAPFLLGPNAPQMLGVAMQQVFSVYYQPRLASALAVFVFLLCSVVGGLYIRRMMREEEA